MWYKKTENGEKVYVGDSIVYNGVRYCNPTEEQLRAAGYICEVEDTAVDMLAQAIEEKIAEIRAYDESDAVNSFLLNGVSVWINREDRIGTTRAIELDKEHGRTESEIWINDMHLMVNCDMALHLLALLGHYAYTAYNNTQKHIYNVRRLETVEDVQSYDYKTGYPEKLNLKTA